MKEKQKNRRNRFNAREDDFILADLDIMRDDEELSPVPLDHLLDDEDAIDRLLIDADFNAEDKYERADWTFSVKAKQASTPAIHSASDFDEIPRDTDAIDRLLVNTGFDVHDEQEGADAQIVDDLNLADENELVVELIEETEQNQQTETNALSVDDSSLDHESGENFDGQSAMKTEAAVVNPETGDAATIAVAQEKNQETVTPEPPMIAGIKPEQVSANPNTSGINALNHNSFEQEKMQRRLDDGEQKIKKTAIISYVSLAIGIIALIATTAMAVKISGMKTEISKLTELVSILEEDMSSITEKNSEMKFNSNDSSIEP